MSLVSNLVVAVIGGLSVYLLHQDNEKTDSETENNHADEISSNSIKTDRKTDNSTVNNSSKMPISDHPTKTLRRGDRFTCSETGEQLQVRAIGGRPKKVASYN